MKKFLLYFNLLALMCLVLEAQGQKENFIWCFGNHAGIDFRTNPPSFLNGTINNSLDNTSSISDSAGNLLFYTDGVNVYSANGSIMPGGVPLMGSSNGGQCALIVPRPGSNLYYVFTVDQYHNNKGCRYSIIDMSLNSGSGAIISSNNLLFTPSTEKLEAVYNCNGNYFWIITHPWGSNEFYVYKLDASGLIAMPVVSQVGSVHANAFNNAMGQMTLSPDKQRLACAIYDDGLIELFDFDINTGILSNAITLTGFVHPLGVAFSPNSQFLYYTQLLTVSIYQVDVSLANASFIQNSKVNIGTVSGPGTQGYYAGYMQLAPDDKIYIASFDDNFLGVINNPNAQGIAALLVDNGFYLPGAVCYGGVSRSVSNYCEETAVSEFAYQNSVSLYSLTEPTSLVLKNNSHTTLSKLTLKIYNALGQEVYDEKIEQLNSSYLVNCHLQGGIYFVSLQNQKAYFRFKILLN